MLDIVRVIHFFTIRHSETANISSQHSALISFAAFLAQGFLRWLVGLKFNLAASIVAFGLLVQTLKHD
jgi:hypothetical protein